MILFKKSIGTILFWSIAFLTFTITSFYLLYRNCLTEEQLTTACSNQPVKTYSYCGTPNLSEEAREGKNLFNNTCAACHKLHAIMTGPALYHTDSIIFHKWFDHQNVKIDSTKLDLFGIDYHRSLSKKIKNSDLEKIYSYIDY
ncbi:c-type cytochrome [Flavobacterium sp. CAU 1735]|uniref:c-type cytochrome n=1 Tax=Flavobacterium sp. CAU 1735 TaxID=3140361 RepID=UPI003261399C